jgi:hypothetical protein
MSSSHPPSRASLTILTLGAILQYPKISINRSFVTIQRISLVGTPTQT